MKPIAPNTLIQNRYLIVHLIGKGGMGEVYLAVDQRLGSAIALKRTFFSDDATLGHAFEREARTLARLRHPVLPKVSDHFTEEGTQYLVMEHISGEDMSKRLEGLDKPFPISWVLFWADQLLDSLNYLHAHEPPIIHRDIKPQNLKLTDENHIVLLDFGLSKNSVGETRATTGGSIVGYTPHYASMEQIRGTGTDARSDLYSLSATLYQILTNNIPPDALTRADSLINGLPDPVTPISDLNPEVSKAVSDVIIKGMAISQEQRYKTAREMQKALRDAYAQLQTDMSANTVAFNTATPLEISPPPPTAAELSAVPPVSQVSAPTAPNNSYSSGANGANAHSSQIPNANKSEPDFDATIRYDGPAPDSEPKQSNIRTEVFLAGSSPAIASVQEENFSKADSFVNRDQTVKAEDFSTQGNFGAAESYSPDATAPLFSFDKTNEAVAAETAVGFDSMPQREEDNTSAGATYVPVADSAPRGATLTPAAAAVTPAKKKSGRGLAVAAGLFALLILAVGAAGIGFYMFKGNGATTDNVTPTPTAQPSVSIEPTVAPTVEAVTETNTNTDVSNSNSLTNTVVGSTVPDDSTNTAVSTRPNQTTVKTTVPPPIRPDTPRQPAQQPVTVIKPPPANKQPPATGKPSKKIIIEP